jgi:hypothetical protein
MPREGKTGFMPKPKMKKLSTSTTTTVPTVGEIIGKAKNPPSKRKPKYDVEEY